MSDLEFTSHSVEQTARWGEDLGRLLVAGDVVCLSGPLGAGKTALTAGIARGWGALEPVNSPTFVFIHEHSRTSDAMRLYHLDCYRLASEADALSIGVEDILSGRDVVVIEWPERILSFLPPDCLWITLELNDDERARRLTVRAPQTHWTKLLDKLR